MDTDFLSLLVAKQMALFSEKNYGTRLAWAYEHYDWKLENLNQVLCTDESKIELFNAKRRTYVRMKANEAPSNETIQKTVKHGCLEFMVPIGWIFAPFCILFLFLLFFFLHFLSKGQI